MNQHRRERPLYISDPVQRRGVRIWLVAAFAAVGALVVALVAVKMGAKDSVMRPVVAGLLILVFICLMMMVSRLVTAWSAQRKHPSA